MQFYIQEKIPDGSEWVSLRESVGFGAYNEQQAVRGLKNSLFCVCALNDAGQTIGMARVVGDGVTCFYIQDVIVRPEYQNVGVGFAMMKRVISYIDENSVPNAVVGLMAAKGKEGFYEKFGFVCRPNDNKGSGMVRL